MDAVVRRTSVAASVRRTEAGFALLTGAAFALLTSVIVTAGDLPCERWLLARTSSGDTLDAVASVVDAGTGYVPVGLVSALLVLALLRRGHTRTAVLSAVSVGGAIAGNTALKRVVDRGRPELLPTEADVSALSYPSGHATATAALAVVVVLLVSRTRWTRAAWLAAVLFVVTAAAAQLVLARHHPSDLAGGWLWAVAWTTAVWAACDRAAPRGGTRSVRSRGGSSA